MNDQAITFDFHNTLIACPEWFELEVRTLPSRFLDWWSTRQGHELTPELVEDADARYRQLRHEIIDHGNELPAEACLEQVFRDMSIEIPADDIAAGIEILMRQALAGASPIPGAVETVQALHRDGIPIGVVSSAVYHPFLEWALEAFGMRDAMQAVITSASAGYYKSRREIYLHAAEKLGADPARMVHVGDSLRFDVGGAQRVGMGTVWLQHEAPSAHDLTVVPDLVLQSLRGSAPNIRALLESRTIAVADDIHDVRA